MEFSKADKKWARFNKKLNELMKASDWFGLGTTYYEMADFISREGKDNRRYRDLGYEMKRRFQLEYLHQMGQNGYVEHVKTLANSDSCKQCKSLNGIKISLVKAIEDTILPVKECSFVPYGCRCVYLPS